MKEIASVDNLTEENIGSIQPHPEIGLEDAVSVYIEPPPLNFTDRSGIRITEEGLTVTFVTDGNGRAGGDYNEGGKKVIEIAEMFAKNHPGVVSAMIAWILSRDNIAKRSDQFFKKIYQAFLGLGINILTKNYLVSSGIRMEIAGDINLLYQKGGAAIDLARMIESVCQLTHHLQKPSLTLKIGIGNDLGKTDVVIRSAAERGNFFRNSGLIVTPSSRKVLNSDTNKTEEVPSPVFLVSVDCLWPELALDAVEQKVLETREQLRTSLYVGHLPYQIAAIEQLLEDGQNVEEQPQSETLPIVDSSERVAKLSKKEYVTIPYSGEPGKIKTPRHQASNSRVEVYDAKNNLFTAFGANPEDATRIYRVVPYNPKDTTTYNIVVATGQTNHNHMMVLPRLVNGGYTMVFSCGSDPGEIRSTLDEALEFYGGFNGLKGAERNIPDAQKDTEENKLEELFYAELAYLQKLKEFFDTFEGKLTLEEVVQRYLGSEPYDPNNKEHYKLLLDFFVATDKSIITEDSKDSDLKGRLADMNYLKTAFGTMYFPSHPQWQDWKKDWVQWAHALANYMRPVGSMDYDVFDSSIAEPEKSIFTGLASATFIAAVNESNRTELHDNELAPPQKKIIARIARDFLNSSNELGQGHPQCFQNWQKTMGHLFECHQKEWLKDVIHNPLLAEKNYDAFAEKYFNGQKSDVLKEQMQIAFSELQNPEETGAIHDLRLFAYLCDIEQSIGAGLVLLTLSCIGTRQNDEIPPTVIEELNQIAFLLNIYFRIMNDLAEVFKEAGDREENFDTCSIAFEKYFQEENKADNCSTPKQITTAALLKSRAYLYKLAKALESEFYEKLENFKRKYKTHQAWERIAVSIVRAIVLGKSFYSREHGGGHYRSTTPLQALDILFNYRNEF